MFQQHQLFLESKTFRDAPKNFFCLFLGIIPKQGGRVQDFIIAPSVDVCGGNKISGYFDVGNPSNATFCAQRAQNIRV